MGWKITENYGRERTGTDLRFDLFDNQEKSRKIFSALQKIADGRVLRYVEGNKTVVLKKDGFEAVLALTEYGEKKSWLLSGWEIGKPDAISEVGTQSDATQSRPTFSRQELGAGLRNIISQSSEDSSDGTENNGELRTGTDLRFEALRRKGDPNNAEQKNELVDGNVPCVSGFMEGAGLKGKKTLCRL